MLKKYREKRIFHILLTVFLEIYKYPFATWNISLDTHESSLHADKIVNCK